MKTTATLSKWPARPGNHFGDTVAGKSFMNLDTRSLLKLMQQQCSSCKTIASSIISLKQTHLQPTKVVKDFKYNMVAINSQLLTNARAKEIHIPHQIWQLSFFPCMVINSISEGLSFSLLSWRLIQGDEAAGWLLEYVQDIWKKYKLHQPTADQESMNTTGVSQAPN